MRTHRALILLVLGGALAAASAAAAAAAADYPFFGYFTSQPRSVGLDEGQLACAFSFFHQGRDGSYTEYVLDEPAYSADETVRFMIDGKGTCTISGSHVETCTVAEAPEKEDIGTSFYDVIGALSAKRVDTTFYDDKASAEAGAADPDSAADDDKFSFNRCPGFDDARLAPFLSTDMTTLTLDERGPLETPDFDDDSRARMLAILRKVGTAQ